MKYVVVPGDVEIIDRKSFKPVIADGAPFVFRHGDFIVDNICSNPLFGKMGVRGIRLQMKLIEKFEKCSPGDVVAIEDADYDKVMPAFESIQWHEAFVRYLPQVIAHVEAWEKAKQQDDKWLKARSIRDVDKIRDAAEVSS